MLQFEILLFAGLTLVPVLFLRRRIVEGLLILFWAHSALLSARHVPLYAIIAAPLCAAQASHLWSEWSAGFGRKSPGGLLRDCLRDFSRGMSRSSVWAPVVIACVAIWPWEGPRDFPENKFPVTAVQQMATSIAPANGDQPRILTSDQWGDYLIYRFYPNQRVFVDGRSDFYGPKLGKEYIDLLTASPGWDRVLERYRFDLALLPTEWPLGQLMMRDPRWQVRYIDSQAVFLERHEKRRLNKNPNSTESIHGGRTE
jgi:hypothetical protein